MITFIKSIEGSDFIFSEIVEDGGIIYDVIAGSNEFQMTKVENQFKFINQGNVPMWILTLEFKLSDVILNRRSM
jgi:hypothetical protein